MIHSDLAEGCFGDRKILLHFFEENVKREAPFVVLLHGVHGCASPAEGNKYGYLCRILAMHGFPACICESSRKNRNRDPFGEDSSAWARHAFQGKTFPMEVFDACVSLAAARQKYPGRRVVLWGFSLGGLIAVLLAGRETERFTLSAGFREPDFGAVDGLVLSGSGDEIRPEARSALSLPVLDTLGDPACISLAASKSRLVCALFFYGSEDKSFSEESCRRIYGKIPLAEGKKQFVVIPGADHAFRKMKGLPSREALDLMGSLTTATLGRFLPGTASRVLREGQPSPPGQGRGRGGGHPFA